MDLDRVIFEESSKPFDDSKNNCAHFVASVVSRFTGRDVHAFTRHSGDDNVREMFRRSRLAALRIGWIYTTVGCAEPGAFGIGYTEKAGTFMCVFSGTCWYAKSPHGLTSVPESAVQRSWSP